MGNLICYRSRSRQIHTQRFRKALLHRHCRRRAVGKAFDRRKPDFVETGRVPQQPTVRTAVLGAVQLLGDMERIKMRDPIIKGLDPGPHRHIVRSG